MWGQPTKPAQSSPKGLSAKRSPALEPQTCTKSIPQPHAARPEPAFFELPAFTASNRMRVTRAVSSTRSLENFAPSPAITEPAASANRNASA